LETISNLPNGLAAPVSPFLTHIQSNLKFLGMYLDRNLSFTTHVNIRLSGSCYVYIRALKHIRPYLTEDIANKLACIIIFFHLDYCNSLFYGISSRNLSRLFNAYKTHYPVSSLVTCLSLHTLQHQYLNHSTGYLLHTVFASR